MKKRKLCAWPENGMLLGLLITVYWSDVFININGLNYWRLFE